MKQVLFPLAEVEYLGCMILKQGLHPTDKVRAVTNTPPPQNVTQLKAFLGDAELLW